MNKFFLLWMTILPMLSFAQEELSVETQAMLQDFSEVLNEEEGALYQAFFQVDRSSRIPSEYRFLSSGLGDIRSNNGSFFYSPLTVYRLFQNLQISSEDKVLLIAHYGDYEEALLKEMGVECFYYSVPPLVERPQGMLNPSQLLFWQNSGPFQGILILEELPQIPPEIFSQLDQNGWAIVALKNPRGLKVWVRIHRVGDSYQMDLLSNSGESF